MSNDPRGRGRGRSPRSATPAVLLTPSPTNNLPKKDQAAKTQQQRTAATRSSSSALEGAGAAGSSPGAAASVCGDGGSRRISLRLRGSCPDKQAVTAAVGDDGNREGSASGGRRGRSDVLGQGGAGVESGGKIDRGEEEQECAGSAAHRVASVGLGKCRDGDGDGDGDGGRRVLTRERLPRGGLSRDGAGKEQQATTAFTGGGKRSGVSDGGGGGSGELSSGPILRGSRKGGKVSGTDGGSTTPSCNSTLRSSGKGNVRRSCSAAATARPGQQEQRSGRRSLGGPRKSASAGSRLPKELTKATPATAGKGGATTTKAGTSHRDKSRGGAAREETARAAAVGGGEKATSKKRPRKRVRLQGEPWVAMWAQGFSDEEEVGRETENEMRNST